MSPIYGSFKIENMGLVLLSESGFSSTSGVFYFFRAFLLKKNSNLLIKKIQSDSRFFSSMVEIILKSSWIILKKRVLCYF